MGEPRDGPPTERTESILLLVERERNRRLLVDHLSESFDVIETVDTGLDEIHFDLCLVDRHSLDEFRGTLESRKAEADPTFLPVALLAESGSVDELPGGIGSVIDELVDIPMSKTQLDARIANLLERRRLSLELTRRKEKSEERFQSLFDTTPDPVVVVSADGTITETNHAFGRVFGLDPTTARGRRITDFEFTPSETVERVLIHVDDFLRGGSSEATVEWDPGDTDPRILEINTELLEGLGDAAERIGIFRDVTDRAEHRDELERQNERLEEFAHTIAHDLQNPLNVAQGRVRMTTQTRDLEHLEAAESALDRMQQLIDEILMLAQEGRAVLEPSDCSLTNVAETAWSHVESRAAVFEISVDGDDSVLADQSRLCELLENLYRNAIEHGGDDVTVRVDSLRNEPGFAVEDDGPGIPSEIRSAVFEAGYTDAEDGTGFGLAIVQQIVDGHDWNIRITDSEAGGARFEIRTGQAGIDTDHDS